MQWRGSRTTACQSWPPPWMAESPDGPPEGDAAPSHDPSPGASRTPGVDGLDVEPPPWRRWVASLSHEHWTRWRRRSSEILATLGHAPTVAEILEADETAAAEVLAEILGRRGDAPAEAVQARVPAPAPCPWRQVVATWPDERRERWGRRSNALEQEGLDRRSAEARAFDEVSSETEGLS